MFLGGFLRRLYGGSEDLLDSFAFLVWVRLFLGMCSWLCFVHLDATLQWLAGKGGSVDDDWFGELERQKAVTKKGGHGAGGDTTTNGVVSGTNGAEGTNGVAGDHDDDLSASGRGCETAFLGGNYYFLAFLLSQFHLLFYCSRSLPNTFALQLCTLALSFWLQRR